MSITVAQALEIGGLNGGRVLARAQNLDNVVEYVNVIEALSEGDWEAGWEVKNHLLLTTFNTAKDDVQKQPQVVEIR